MDLQTAFLAYIDDQAQYGNPVELTELEDVVRETAELAEEAIAPLTREIVEGMIQDGILIWSAHDTVELAEREED